MWITIILTLTKAKVSSIAATVLLDVLENILAEQLTTISFPHTFRMRHFNYITFGRVIKLYSQKISIPLYID